MASRLLERTPPADHFLFITGHAGDPKVRHFLTEQEVKYLVKPFPVLGLIDCVRELLA